MSTKMLINKQILFHPGNCLNLKKPYPQECQQCIICCPHEAISAKKDIIRDKCTECGVCMAVCPSDGFVDRDMKRLEKYLFESGEIILNCPLAEPLGYEIPCLGMLDRDAWSTLILLADYKEVRLITGDCGSCEDRAACAASVSSLKEVLHAQVEPPSIKIEILPALADSSEAERKDKAKFPAKKISDARISLRQQGKEKIKTLFPMIEAEETNTIPRTRQWFAQALSLNPEKKISYKAIKADNNCTNCGVCAKICPQGALQQVQKDERIRLIYEPLKCVQCSRCVNICRTDALKFDEIEFSSKFLNGKILLIDSVAKYCLKCGKQIFHNIEPSLCMACAVKDPNLKGVFY